MIDPDKFDPDLLTDYLEFAEKTFSKTTKAVSLKILEEAQELAQDPDDPEEAIDVLMCIQHHLHLMGIDVEKHYRAKLAKLKSRSWKMNPNGTYSHVKKKRSLQDDIRQIAIYVINQIKVDQMSADTYFGVPEVSPEEVLGELGVNDHSDEDLAYALKVIGGLQKCFQSILGVILGPT